MIKNLVKHGNSWALVIDRPILELLKIDPESPLEITTDGRSMLIAPASGSDHQDRVAVAREKVIAKFDKAFKKLAE
jgi:antitoxin component of MazEF toxin-antitoxin module